MRLNKFLSEAGVCSRREADRQIDAGNVKVNGLVATLGTQVEEKDLVELKGQVVKLKEEKVYLMLNKPLGVECTSSTQVKNNIIDFVNYPSRVYPVGRLDKNSEGLILLTNDGELANRLMKARYFHEKFYWVKVDRPFDQAFIDQMSQGVEILETVTRPCKVTPKGDQVFEIVLTQGLNRQIRRMCEALGYRVEKLKRFKILNLDLGALAKGKWRHLTHEELKQLKEMVFKDE